MNFFDHKDLGNHLLQLCPKVVKHPVFEHNEDALFINSKNYIFMFLMNLNCPSHFQDQYPYISVESTGCRGDSDLPCKSHILRKRVRRVILSEEK
jgi:hypothetical protein